MAFSEMTCRLHAGYMQVTCRLHAGYIQAGKDYKRFSELSNHRLSSSKAHGCKQHSVISHSLSGNEQNVKIFKTGQQGGHQGAIQQGFNTVHFLL